MLQWMLLLCFSCLMVCTHGQTVGGNAVFNFLQQPNSAQLSALGGVNVSNITNDVGLAFHNPSLLRKEQHTQVNASFNLLLGGIKNYSITSAYHHESSATSVALGINYFNYGTIPQTDASGNEMGSFKPNDYVVQVMAARQHKERWHYGGTFKFVNSMYGAYSSNGIALDVGITYTDTANGLQAAVVAKNMGTQLKTYDGTSKKEELPFDLQAGVTKRLAKAPIQFSLTAHNLHRFNIYYNDTAFLASEGVDDFRGKRNTISKMISHLVLAMQVYLKEKVEITAGYNFLRRHDLNAVNAANGLNGFTIGAGLVLRDLQVRYATGFYQQNMFNQLGINFTWK
ncbi:type IX secretion system protein PorQ [Aridibaculum aurantiacum]|uniref:type IX secretion system protein PorQ n=1 Tax=Aridibaculum aurantiacum TaxID=2810307 RepID=UPI001A96B2F4|nr:type IX secretion system protein PorQ [Aridibaculum aurantiacum]